MSWESATGKETDEDNGNTSWDYIVEEKTVNAETGGVEYIDVVGGGSGQLTFNSSGKIQLPPPPDDPDSDPSIIKINATGAEQIKIKPDFSAITQFAADCSVKPTNIDGYTTGNLVTFNVGSDGMLTGVYSNGQQQPLGLIALASFSNPAGLQKVGDNLFIPTTNSGDFTKGVPAGSEGVGNLSPGTLEMSNVDLSREFTDMIVTQRGFQANSRIITTSDEMLQELVNLKR
jgi:flagellar hook protein FlgE